MLRVKHIRVCIDDIKFNCSMYIDVEESNNKIRKQVHVNSCLSNFDFINKQIIYLLLYELSPAHGNVVRA